MTVHPSSVVEDGATIGAGVEIGPFCHVGARVILGEGVRLRSHVSVTGITHVGERCDLLIERGARIVGTDCLSVDCFGSEDFAAHNTLLSAGILIGENFARLGELPPHCFLITLPLPIENGTGSPLRAVALIEGAV